MAYSAKAFKIMIASPGDVVSERQIARDVIHEWNAVNSEHRGVVLLPAGWETHANPEMGDRAQEIINRQVLRDCDVLIAIFWTRLGTPTGSARSGTAEEIEEHLRAGKPAMIYFSTQLVTPESVDAEQYKRLREFKVALEKRGLIEKYESLSEFREKLTRHLAQVAIRKLIGDTASEADDVQGEQAVARTSPRLSALAKEILIAAAHDPSGTVLLFRTTAGTTVQSNGRDFAEPRNPRSEAEGEAAVEELERLGLIRDRHNHEVFSITDRGFRTVDLIGGTAA